MDNDLIFHIVSKRKWRENFQNGIYSLKTDGESEKGTEIECVRLKGLNEYLNLHFKGRKNLFILVIDTSRLERKPVKMEGSGIFIIGNKIRSEAILDKIRIDCGKEGQFDLSVFSN